MSGAPERAAEGLSRAFHVINSDVLDLQGGYVRRLNPEDTPDAVRPSEAELRTRGSRQHA